MKEKIKELSENGILELIVNSVFIVTLFIVISNSYSVTSVDIENKVFNNFCNYAIENKYISVEEYVKKYETDYEKESFLATYDNKELCMDMYVNYITELTNEK